MLWQPAVSSTDSAECTGMQRAALTPAASHVRRWLVGAYYMLVTILSVGCGPARARLGAGHHCHAWRACQATEADAAQVR